MYVSHCLFHTGVPET